MTRDGNIVPLADSRTHRRCQQVDPRLFVVVKGLALVMKGGVVGAGVGIAYTQHHRLRTSTNVPSMAFFDDVSEDGMVCHP